MARRALVTGGAGFIGSHLSEALLAAGWEVFVLDDVSTGSLNNVAHLRDRRDYHLVVDSVLSPSVVSEVVHKCDVVFHMAAAVGVRLIVEQPVHTMVTNVQGTETVLGYCSKFGKRVLIASSSEVYGDGTQTRSFCHVSDTVRALTGLMDAEHISGEIYNVGSAERVRIIDLAERIKQAAGSDSQLAFIPYERVYDQGIEDTLHREPAIGKIKDAIGWEPTLDLDRIIADVIAHERCAPQAAEQESVEAS